MTTGLSRQVRYIISCLVIHSYPAINDAGGCLLSSKDLKPEFLKKGVPLRPLILGPCAS
jgi:hypothetical protein